MCKWIKQLPLIHIAEYYITGKMNETRTINTEKYFRIKNLQNTKNTIFL